jgi:hypothetical protein
MTWNYKVNRRPVLLGGDMKLHDFGLWYWADGRWTTTIPDIEENFSIYYDGYFFGRKFQNYLSFFGNISYPYKINFKGNFLDITTRDDNYSGYCQYVVDRRLTMEDFEVIPNPDYIGV